MLLCSRHEDALVMALTLRGLLRPTLTSGVDEAPLVYARQAITTHATHFAGKAAIEMLAEHHCPLCFVNRNPAHVSLEGWIDNAADEAEAAALRREDGEPAAPVRLI